MDQSNQLIKKVQSQILPRLVIETSVGKRYLADLSRFKGVYCFPKSQAEWNEVSVTTAGYALIWPSRFEVHVDQVIDAAIRVEDVRQTA
ncbi:MAG: hypothetical protein HY537_14750 [Deltaproteobacteria bacterium]|nr:hypothetical protein [Deltaproteobacteria bacterium]